MLTAYCSALPVNSDRGKQKSAEILKITLDKSPAFLYNPFCQCGRGGIGIRVRLRGVSVTGYGFKSHRPHHDPLFLKENQGVFLSEKPLRAFSGLLSAVGSIAFIFSLRRYS